MYNWNFLDQLLLPCKFHGRDMYRESTFSFLPLCAVKNSLPLAYIRHRTSEGKSTDQFMQIGLSKFLCMSSTLKVYSVVPTTSFYGINQNIKTKKIISEISVASNFRFSSYA